MKKDKATFIVEGNIQENMQHELSKKIDSVCKEFGLESYLDDVIEDKCYNANWKCKKCSGVNLTFLARVNINTNQVECDFDLGDVKCDKCGVLEDGEWIENADNICEHNNTITNECSDCNEQELKEIKMTRYEAVGLAEGFIEAESEEQVINAWQYLVDTGLAWQLQGSFGRTATNLIEQGVVMIKCPTCEETRYIKNKGCTDTICPEFEIITEEE